jgi:hypothetical protein
MHLDGRRFVARRLERSRCWRCCCLNAVVAAVCVFIRLSLRVLSNAVKEPRKEDDRTLERFKDRAHEPTAWATLINSVCLTCSAACLD